jgi:hypothetical protein
MKLTNNILPPVIYYYVLRQSPYRTGRWFFPGPSVSSTNKTDSHDVAEILMKVALDTINQAKTTPECTNDIATMIAGNFLVRVFYMQCNTSFV